MSDDYIFRKFSEGERPMEDEYFAGRLRELREAAGWTQQQLADAAGLTREGVAQLETGRRAPVWKSVLMLAKALGVSCDAFAQPPAEREPPGPGRPPKATVEADEPHAPKRPRGRPKKDATAEGNATTKATKGKRQ
jgi:transcriptional regulator with XRE-family HTH domain